MDKGLLKLNELCGKLMTIEDESIKIRYEINNLNQTKKVNENHKNIHKNTIKDLSYKKNKIYDARKKLKKSKLSILFYYICLILSIINLAINMFNSLGALSALIPACFVVASSGALVLSYTNYFSIKKDCDESKLLHIEKLVKDNENKLKLLDAKQNNIDKKITELTSLYDELFTQGNNIIEQINKLRNVRSEVMQRYIENTKNVSQNPKVKKKSIK